MSALIDCESVVWTVARWETGGRLTLIVRVLCGLWPGETGGRLTLIVRVLCGLCPGGRQVGG